MKYGKQIGKGSFTTAYLDPKNKKKVLLVSRCHAKEALAIGYKPNGRRWPKIKRLAYMIDNHNNSLYSMPLYTKITNPKKQMNTVDHKAYLQARKIFQRYNPYREDNFHKLAYKFCSNSLAKQFCIMYDGIKNYTEFVGFEVSPRNVALRSTGGLVWLDLFFNLEQL